MPFYNQPNTCLTNVDTLKELLEAAKGIKELLEELVEFFVLSEGNEASEELSEEEDPSTM